MSHAPTLVFFKLSAQKISKGPRKICCLFFLVGGEIWSWYDWIPSSNASYHFHEHWLVGKFSTSRWYVTAKTELSETWQGHFGLWTLPNSNVCFPKISQDGHVNLPKQATWQRFICFSCKSPMTSRLKNPPRMAWNNFCGGDMDQVWIQHDTKVLQNMRDFGRKSGDVEDVHILYPSTVWLWNWSSKIHFFHENFPIGSIKQKNINLQPYPQRMQISLAQISLGCSQIFFLPLYSNPKGGVPVPPSCRFVVRAPKHRDAKNFFAHQLQAGSHRHALRQCLDPGGWNQRRPAGYGCSRTIQFKINDKCIWLYH